MEQCCISYTNGSDSRYRHLCHKPIYTLNSTVAVTHSSVYTIAIDTCFTNTNTCVTNAYVLYNNTVKAVLYLPHVRPLLEGVGLVTAQGVRLGPVRSCAVQQL
jgi:hypothetical protein